MTTCFIVRQLQNEFPLNSVVPINLTRKLLNLFPLWTSSNQCRQTWERFEWDRLNFEEPLSMPKVYPTFSICRMSAVSYSFSSRSFTLSFLFFSISLSLFLFLSLSLCLNPNQFLSTEKCLSQSLRAHTLVSLHTHTHTFAPTHTHTFAHTHICTRSLAFSLLSECLSHCLCYSVCLHLCL